MMMMKITKKSNIQFENLTKQGENNYTNQDKKKFNLDLKKMKKNKSGFFLKKSRTK